MGMGRDGDRMGMGIRSSFGEGRDVEMGIERSSSLGGGGGRDWFWEGRRMRREGREGRLREGD